MMELFVLKERIGEGGKSEGEKVRGGDYTTCIRWGTTNCSIRRERKHHNKKMRSRMDFSQKAQRKEPMHAKCAYYEVLKDDSWKSIPGNLEGKDLNYDK